MFMLAAVLLLPFLIGVAVCEDDSTMALVGLGFKFKFKLKLYLLINASCC